MSAAAPAPSPRGSALEVFVQALRLGLSSFGGPIAHLGYYERTYVRRLHWLAAEEYAAVVALCQLLPGPASSQVGFLVGMRRAGWAGAVGAWLGFTLPSALLMYGFALWSPDTHSRLAAAVLHGLKLVAVAVVAQAVWSMAQRLCPDRRRAAIGLLAGALLLVLGSAAAQLAVLLLGGLAGLLLCRGAGRQAAPLHGYASRRSGWLALAAFIVLLAGLPLLATAAPHSTAALAALFYRAGSLVFGGGHVVLPLLRSALVPAGWIGDDRFLAGYGFAQALPGPLFAFSAYVGAVAGAGSGHAALWAATALLCIFLPGLLLAAAASALWQALARAPAAGAALAGVNAAVVGVLGAALYDPVWTSAVARVSDVAIAAAGLLLLQRWRVAPIAVVAIVVGLSVWLGPTGL